MSNKLHEIAFIMMIFSKFIFMTKYILLFRTSRFTEQGF